MKFVLKALVFFSLIPSSQAMDFRVEGDKLVAIGGIEQGDADRFAKIVSTVSKEDDNGAPNLTVVLNSPGGSLLEGMRLGNAIRTAGIPTIVLAGQTCASACAIAFLGGKISGVANDAVGRKLEPGARLGFHGYRLDSDEVHVANETLDASRVINAIILEYADRMGSVDLGVLAELLNVAPEKIELINTPREMAALGISFESPSIKLPKEWALNACRATVRSRLSALDAYGADNRVDDKQEPMPNLASFRTRMLDDKFAADSKTDAIRAALMKLPPADALDLLVGQALYLNQGKVGAWRVPLERGSGFYFDACYAVTDFHSIRTVLVDGVSPATIVHSASLLEGFPANSPLW